MIFFYSIQIFKLESHKYFFEFLLNHDYIIFLRRMFLSYEVVFLVKNINPKFTEKYEPEIFWCFFFFYSIQIFKLESHKYFFEFLLNQDYIIFLKRIFLSYEVVFLVKNINQKCSGWCFLRLSDFLT